MTRIKKGLKMVYMFKKSSSLAKILPLIVSFIRKRLLGKVNNNPQVSDQEEIEVDNFSVECVESWDKIWPYL